MNRFSLDPPEISNFVSEPSVITNGGNVILTCMAEGNPQPEVSLLRNGEKLDGEYGNGMGRVELTRVEWTDAGEYQCIATNGIGSNDTGSVNVTVLCKYSFQS